MRSKEMSQNSSELPRRNQPARTQRSAFRAAFPVRKWDHALLRLTRRGHEAEQELSFLLWKYLEINDIHLPFTVGVTTSIRDDGDKKFFLVLRHD